MARIGTGTLLRLAGTTLLVLTALGGAARADDVPPVTMDYQGSYDWTRALGGNDVVRAHAQWELVWDLHPPLAAPAWRIVSLTGTIAAVLAPPNDASSCSGTLTDNPALPLLSTEPRPDYELGSNRTLVQAGAEAPLSFHSSSPATPGNFCGNAPSGEWHPTVPMPTPDPLAPAFDYKIGSGAKTVPFDETWDDPNGAGLHLVLDSTLTMNGTTPPLPKTPKSVRDAAVAGLRAEVPQGLYPCVTAVTGAVVFVAGGAAGVFAGATMVAVAAPACARVVTMLQGLQETYKDPPVTGFRRAGDGRPRSPAGDPVRSVPDPPGRPPAAVRPAPGAARTWVVALQRVAETSTALATTVGRESAARAAGDATAVALQTRTAVGLLPTLRADERQQGVAGAALAARLRAVGATGRLTRAQSTTAIADLLARVVGAGVAEADLRAEAPAALAPRARDLVALLRQRVG